VTTTAVRPTGPGSFQDLPVRDFLELLAAREPAPGGGAAAALTAALAAGLVGMAARFSKERLTASADIARQADELRARAADLADQDAGAFRGVLDAYRRPKEGDGGDRHRRIAVALDAAARVPLEVAEIAARVAGLAEAVAGGNPNLQGDTVAAAQLAEASARSAAALVDINAGLGGLPGELSRRGAAAVASAQAAAANVGAAPA
jgi:formiminotetrahydrofolate cyclodeaminase